MSHELDTLKIRQQLNRSAAQLDQPVLARLRHARLQALERHAVHAEEAVPAWAGAHGFSAHVASHRNQYRWAALILLTACLYGGINYWQGLQDNDEDVDIAILTDEMPIDVYTD